MIMNNVNKLLCVLLLYLIKISYSDSSKLTRKVIINYPVELLAPIVGNNFQGFVSRNKLLCFSNRDYSYPSYIETLVCMFPGTLFNNWINDWVSEWLSEWLNKYLSKLNTYDCYSLWGSRSVIIETIGSVEFFKVSHLPQETESTSNSISVSRWYEHQFDEPITSAIVNSNARSSSSNGELSVKYIPAEPIVLCARSSEWLESSYFKFNSNEIFNSHNSFSNDGVINSDNEIGLASFSIHFRKAYLRESDRLKCFNKILLHLILIIIASSSWLLPYLISTIVFTLCYNNALKYEITIILISVSVICLTPIMILTKKNRSNAKHYIKYFISRIQAEETRNIIRKRIIVIQALYFSSVFICIGSTISYLFYNYFNFNFDRESKNILIKVTISIGISWFSFSCSRSFERFLSNWFWMILSLGLAEYLDSHLNPSLRNEVIVVILFLSFVIKELFIRIRNLYKFESAIEKFIIYSRTYLYSRMVDIPVSLFTKKLSSHKVSIRRGGSSVDTVSNLTEKAIDTANQLDDKSPSDDNLKNKPRKNSISKSDSLHSLKSAQNQDSVIESNIDCNTFDMNEIVNNEFDESIDINSNIVTEIIETYSSEELNNLVDDIDEIADDEDDDVLDDDYIENDNVDFNENPESTSHAIGKIIQSNEIKYYEIKINEEIYYMPLLLSDTLYSILESALIKLNHSNISSEYRPSISTDITCIGIIETERYDIALSNYKFKLSEIDELIRNKLSDNNLESLLHDIKYKLNFTKINIIATFSNIQGCKYYCIKSLCNKIFRQCINDICLKDYDYNNCPVIKMIDDEISTGDLIVLIGTIPVKAYEIILFTSNSNHKISNISYIYYYIINLCILLDINTKSLLCGFQNLIDNVIIKYYLNSCYFERQREIDYTSDDLMNLHYFIELPVLAIEFYNSENFKSKDGKLQTLRDNIISDPQLFTKILGIIIISMNIQDIL